MWRKKWPLKRRSEKKKKKERKKTFILTRNVKTVTSQHRLKQKHDTGEIFTKSRSHNVRFLSLTGIHSILLQYSAPCRTFQKWTLSKASLANNTSRFDSFIVNTKHGPISLSTKDDHFPRLCPLSHTVLLTMKSHLIYLTDLLPLYCLLDLWSFAVSPIMLIKWTNKHPRN